MRPRREPRPARRPRIVTVRMVVVALVFGVVLAVVSVPVGVAIDRIPWVASKRSVTEDWYTIDGRRTIVARTRSATLDGFTWSRGYAAHALNDGAPRPTVHKEGERPDPRPPAIGRWFDASTGLAVAWHAGWPLRAAHGEKLMMLSGYTGSMSAIAPETAGVWERTAFGRDWFIPYLPLWPGLLGNTLFYAVLVLTPLVLLRWRTLRGRARRGLCVGCGYEPGEGVSACPECGLARAGA